MKNSSILQNFSRNLKTMRQVNGISQVDLGEMMGYGQNQISYWENGKVFPGIKVLLSLSAIFDVTLDALLHYPNAVMGRCNPVCMTFRQVVRAEKKMNKHELVEWKQLKLKIIDLMQIENNNMRQRYLAMLKPVIDDLHILATKEIIKKAV